MRWTDIPFRPPSSTLRRFGLASVVLLTGLAAWDLWQERWISAAAVLAPALVLASFALFHPPALRPVYVGLMVATFPLGWLMTHLILGLIFFCIFTPLGLLFKLVGRDLLERRFRAPQETYW